MNTVFVKLVFHKGFFVNHSFKIIFIKYFPIFIFTAMSRCGFWSWRPGGGTGSADDHIEHKAVADMKKIFELLSEIRPADQKAMEAARLRWNSVAKPIGSLGILEEDIIKIAGILGISQVQVSRLEKKILREMREMAG